MQVRSKAFLAIITIVFNVPAQAQQDATRARQNAARNKAIAAEARIPNYIMSGYDLGLYYYPRESRFSFGVSAAGQQIDGASKRAVFRGSNLDNLDIRLNWLFSSVIQYHLTEHGEGLFLGLGIGVEEFEARQGNEERSDLNGFVSPSVGYIWYPWRRDGFYLLPKITAPLILARPDEYRFSDGTSFRLRPVFPSPSIAVGWKFPFKR